MQIFWVSGPVGRIRSFNLSLKTVVIGMVVLSLALIVTGSVLQFLGFRMALEYDPQIARRLGNLHTALEVENLNAVYHRRLGELESEHRKLLEQIGQLQGTTRQLAELLPGPVSKDMPRPSSQGGVYLPAADASTDAAGSVLERMDQMLRMQRSRAALLDRDIEAWRQSLTWLQGVPIGLPLGPGRVAISSGFGERTDPLTQRPAMHTGLDFEMPVGTPILAAGAGVVVEAGWDGPYGHSVLLRHQDGYSSRYAHASELKVKPGDTVSRGQLIALSGNSGRSTGPHLHFEVLRHGRPLDPAQYLTALAVRR